MNLNKYHSTGRLYTEAEALNRATAMYVPKYAFLGRSLDEVGPKSRLKPYRNAEKAAARAMRSRMKTVMVRERV